MPEEITVTPKTEAEPVPAASAPDSQNVSLPRTQLVNLCAVGLGVSFFLPWAHVLFASPSGFDLQKGGDGELLLWSIPIGAAITAIAGLVKSRQTVVGRLTGILPFIVGIYWYNRIGSDLLQMLAVGGYLSLVFGAALLVLPKTEKQS